MIKTKTLCVIGVSALIVGAAVGVSSSVSLGSGRDGAVAKAATQSIDIDRTRKSDRLATARDSGAAAASISTVEVVGVRDAAIIYRDRDGNLLYRSDPLNNATLITKGVVLPEVTVREAPGRAVREVSRTVPTKNEPAASQGQQPTATTPVRRTRIPEGCDAAASPIAAPQMAHILSKCMVEAPTSIKVASLY